MKKNTIVSQSYLKAKRVVLNENNNIKHLKVLEQYVNNFCNGSSPENEKTTIHTLFNDLKQRLYISLYSIPQEPVNLFYSKELNKLILN